MKISNFFRMKKKENCSACMSIPNILKYIETCIKNISFCIQLIRACSIEYVVQLCYFLHN